MTYDKKINESQVGDYVLINVDNKRYSEEFKNVLETTIGKMCLRKINADLFVSYNIRFSFPKS